jgi:site-specific recombinase XerD
VRVERAIDAFLDWRRLERDATKRSDDSYRRILEKLAEDYPEVSVDALTTADLRHSLRRWQDRSAATRSNVISVFHSFFAWAEAEDLVEVDASGRSAGLRSGSRTCTGRAWTSFAGFERRLWDTSALLSS